LRQQDVSSRPHEAVGKIKLIRGPTYRGRIVRSLARGNRNGMMAPWLVDATGATGAVLTTLCWVPQAIKIVRERETRAISLPGTWLCVLGVLLWLIYGLAIADGPLIGSSIVTLAMTGTILALKIRHG
jgi:MtN3 and saliva related transmembrane protein